MVYERVDPGRICWDLLWFQALVATDNNDASYVPFTIGLATLVSIPVSVIAVAAQLRIQAGRAYSLD